MRANPAADSSTRPRRLSRRPNNGPGTAGDNFAIRVVRWYDTKDCFGTAALTWDAEDSLSSDRAWVTRWRIRGVPLSPGTNRIAVAAEDIKGLATVRTLTVRR